MLDLETHNRIILDTVRSAVEAAKAGAAEHVEVTCADFDGVSYRLTNENDDANVLLVSISTRCFATLREHNVEAQLKKIYGAHLASAADGGFDATLRIVLSDAPADEEFFLKVANLKRHTLAAPFYNVFEQIDAKKNPGLCEVQYRAEEAFYLKPEGNGCTCIFSIFFRDKDDVLFAKVFLQAFQDSCKKIRGAPRVTFTQKEPPLELQNVASVSGGDDRGFVSFALFPDHLHKQRRDKTVDHVLLFRNYLQYHIKCSKAYLHQRMRARVESLLQVLNRAKQPTPEDEKKMKTFGGKSFQRK